MRQLCWHTNQSNIARHNNLSVLSQTSTKRHCAAHAGADVLQLAHVPVGGDGQQHGERVGGDCQGVCEWLNIREACPWQQLSDMFGQDCATATLSMLLLCVLIRADGAEWCGASVLRHIRAPFSCAQARGAGLPAELLANRCAYACGRGLCHWCHGILT